MHAFQNICTPKQTYLYENIYLFKKIYVLILKSEFQRKRERYREIFQPLVHSPRGAGLVLRQETKVSSWSPMWLLGTQVLGPQLAVCQDAKGHPLEMESDLMPDTLAGYMDTPIGILISR